MSDEIKKYVNCGLFPFNVKGKPVHPGGTFELAPNEQDVFLNQLIGAGRACLATDENVKRVNADIKARADAEAAAAKAKDK